MISAGPRETEGMLDPVLHGVGEEQEAANHQAAPTHQGRQAGVVGAAALPGLRLLRGLMGKNRSDAELAREVLALLHIQTHTPNRNLHARPTST